MISLFRKPIALHSTVHLGVLACLLAAAAAEAQVATRTQVVAQRSDGVLSFTARVSDAGGAPVSEGSVSFETAKGSLGSVFVREGSATLNLTNPPQWARTVTAVYHGDSAFANSDASTDVSADASSSSLPGFTVTASPSSLSLTAGQFGTVQLTVTSQNGFSEAVNLSCSGLPGASSCNFNPVVLTPPANGSINSAMQITTMATSGRLDGPPGPSHNGHAVYAVMIPGLLALAGVGAVRRKNFTALRAVGLLMLLAAGTVGLSSCAQRYSYLHHSPTPNFGTASGTYTVIVSAFSANGTSITQATSSDPSCSGAVCVTLTVQ
jgi:hypothetical protein